jgi:hypothetical protein
MLRSVVLERKARDYTVVYCITISVVHISKAVVFLIDKDQIFFSRLLSSVY